MITDVLAWLVDPVNWSGPTGISARLVEHLWYSAVALLLAAVAAIPVGLWVGHSGRGRWVVSVANASRAVPSLGLLFAVALWLGPHIRGSAAFLVPSLVVLVLLAMPPLLAGAYAGVEAVDPAATDAARGMGMRPGQVLRRVQLPCALPLVISGIRSATLQVIATATIGATISLGGLGRFLIDGQAATDYAQMAGGALLVGALALIVDLVLAGLTRLVVSPGLQPPRPGSRRRSSRRPSTATAPNQSSDRRDPPGSSTRAPTPVNARP